MALPKDSWWRAEGGPTLVLRLQTQLVLQGHHAASREAQRGAQAPNPREARRWAEGGSRQMRA